MKSFVAKYTLPLQNERERICDFDIIIQKLPEIQVPQGQALARAGIWNMVQTLEGTSVYRTFPEAPGIVSARMDFFDRCVKIYILSVEGVEPSAREIVFAGQALGQMLLRHKRMVLHSSCIARNGKAVLFSAPSGTGKSTHTGLWRKYYPDTFYINDDTPILRLDNPDEVLACGSPWSGKEHLNQNIQVPLAGIVFLERGKNNIITPLPKAEAMGRLLGECRKIPFRDAMQEAAELCGQLIDRVPIYRLSCDISQEAVETVRKELLL